MRQQTGGTSGGSPSCTLYFPRHGDGVPTTLFAARVDVWGSIHRVVSGATSSCPIRWPRELNKKQIVQRNAPGALPMLLIPLLKPIGLLEPLSYIWQFTRKNSSLMLLLRTIFKLWSVRFFNQKYSTETVSLSIRIDWEIQVDIVNTDNRGR